jgi:EpsI family protein
MAGMLLAFWPTVLSFHDVWTSESYKHGYLIAATVVWMVWRQRDVALTWSPGGSPGLLAVASLSLLWLLAAIMNIRVIQQGLLPALGVGWVFAAMGRSAALRLLPAALVFLVAIPVWEATLRPLQMAAVAVSGTVLGIARIPAVVEGNIVTINSGSFLIEGSCAGLNYLMVGLTLGVVYGQLFMHGWRRRAQLVLLAAGAAILANWVRVTTIIIVGHVTSMQSDLPEHHGLFGWQVFVVTMLVVLPFARMLEARDRAERREAVMPAADLVEDPEVARSNRRDSPTPGAAIAATALAVLGPLVFVTVGMLPTRGAAGVELFSAVEDWTALGTAGRPHTWMPDFQGADEHLSAAWSDDSTQVVLDRLVYRGQTQGAELINFNNRIAPAGYAVRERLVGPMPGTSAYAWEAVVWTPEKPVLVRYWYRVAGHDTFSRTRAKLLEVVAFFTRIEHAELVALSAPCEPDSCAVASEALNRFMRTSR